MAEASNFLIGANDEHGLNPPTIGKRTPQLPYINRVVYENEFNRVAKHYFIIACLRCGFRVYDVKPEITDTSVSTRVARVNSRGVSLLVTFAYNAYGDGTSFTSPDGYIVFYSKEGFRPTQSRLLAYDVSAGLKTTMTTDSLGVGTLSGVGVLSSVRCPSVLLECGFMTNLSEAKLMLDDEHALNAGEGACKGVCEYLDVPYIAPSAVYATLRRGSRGNVVAILQYILRRYGYDITPDGVFGSRTEAAVKNYQAENGLTADGIVGRNTWISLNRAWSVPPTVRRGSRGMAVKYLQSKLASKLYYGGAQDGIFGSGTERAVREFQAENGLAVDGIAGRNTFAALRPIGGGRS